MSAPGQQAQAAFFYAVSLEDHVPLDHLLRSINRFVDLSSTRTRIAVVDGSGFARVFFRDTDGASGHLSSRFARRTPVTRKEHGLRSRTS